MDTVQSDRVLSCLGLLYVLTVRMIQRARWRVSFDDLYQWGALGLIDAAQRFDETRGPKFSSFAFGRIRGAMLDGWRQEGWGSRDYPGPPPISLDWLMAPTGSNADDSESTSSFQLAGGTEPEDDLAPAWEAEVVQQAMEGLGERDRTMIRLFYFDGWSQVAIGRRYGVTGSRISQILTTARARLRPLLEAANA